MPPPTRDTTYQEPDVRLETRHAPKPDHGYGTYGDDDDDGDDHIYEELPIVEGDESAVQPVVLSKPENITVPVTRKVTFDFTNSLSDPGTMTSTMSTIRSVAEPDITASEPTPDRIQDMNATVCMARTADGYRLWCLLW